MDFIFNDDWFSGNIPVWTDHLVHLAGTECKILEVGSHEGRSCVWLCQNILVNDNSHIDCIDIFDNPEIFDHFKHNISFFKDKVSYYQGDSKTELASGKFKTDYYDAIYIDGNHEAEYVLSDALLSFPLLKKGGILIFDDVEGGATVRDGLNKFLETHASKIEIVSEGYQHLYKKIAD